MPILPCWPGNVGPGQMLAWIDGVFWVPTCEAPAGCGDAHAKCANCNTGA